MTPEHLQQPSPPLSQAQSKAEKLNAISVLAAHSGQARDKALLQFLGADPALELREHAALALSSSKDSEIIPSLAALLTRENDSQVRYALRNAIGAVERATRVPDAGLSLRLSTAGLARANSPGVVTMDVQSQAGDGFARIGFTLPPGMTLLSGEDYWYGLLRRGEPKQLQILVSPSTDGVYHITAVFWLKLQAGETFKGGSRIKRETIPIVIGSQQASQPTATTGVRP